MNRIELRKLPIKKIIQKWTEPQNSVWKQATRRARKRNNSISNNHPEKHRTAATAYKNSNLEVHRIAAALYQINHPEYNRVWRTLYDRINPWIRQDNRVLTWKNTKHSGLAYNPKIYYKNYIGIIVSLKNVYFIMHLNGKVCTAVLEKCSLNLCNH